MSKGQILQNWIVQSLTIRHGCEFVSLQKQENYNSASLNKHYLQIEVFTQELNGKNMQKFKQHDRQPRV